MVFMVGPALAGLWLDRQLGTEFLSVIGVMLGMALGMAALLVLVNVKRPSLDEEVNQELDHAGDKSRGGGRASPSRPEGLRSQDGADDDQASP
jgi:hypothetical protein